MPSPRDKQKALEKVLRSKEFAGSELSQRLLQYLAKASESGTTPKETTIAIEVFGRHGDYDPSSDAYVRSFVYKVRKKLEHYYEHEGKNDKIRLVIPKGQYHVEFQRRDSRNRQIPRLSRLRAYKRLSAALAAALLILASLVFLIQKFRLTPAQRLARSPVWQDLFASPAPILIVPGDVFMFLEYRSDLDSWRLVAEPYVIDAREFEQYRASHPREEVYPASFSMLPRNVIDALINLVPFFHGNHRALNQKFCSRLQWDDINRNSIVYIGGTSGLYLLRHIISLTHFRFRPVNRYFIVDAHNDTLLKLIYKDPGTTSNEYRDEYAYVAKVPGPRDNVVYFFIGMDYNSRVSAVRKMLDPKFFAELDSLFEEKFGHFPRYFEVLWKVGGYKEAAYVHKIVYFNSLETIKPPTPR